MLETSKSLERGSVVDGPLLKQNGISQTRSSYQVKGVSMVKIDAIRRGKKEDEEEWKHSVFSYIYSFSFIPPGLMLSSLSIR